MKNINPQKFFLQLQLFVDHNASYAKISNTTQALNVSAHDNPSKYFSVNDI